MLSACRARTDTTALSTLCSFTRTAAASSSGGTALPSGSSAHATRVSAAPISPPPTHLPEPSRRPQSTGRTGLAFTVEGEHAVPHVLVAREPGIDERRLVPGARADRGPGSRCAIAGRPAISRALQAEPVTVHRLVRPGHDDARAAVWNGSGIRGG